MNYTHIPSDWDQKAGSSTADDPRTEISRVLSMFRRRYWMMIVASVVCVALAFLFLAVVQPTYTSLVRILLDEDRTSPLASTVEVSNPNNVDEYIATQVTMIQSDVIAQRVADALSLNYDGELTMEMTSVLDAIEPTVEPAAGSEATVASVPPQQRILNALKASTSVYRLDESFVVEVGIRTRSAELSQRIAAAYGEAYIADQLASRLEAHRRTASWLEERIEALRIQSLEAAQAVQRFRAENNLVSTGGQLVSDQQLSGLNTQYVLAQQAAAGAQARLDVFQLAVAGGDVNAIAGLFTRLPDLPQNAGALQLANQYAEATERAAAIARNWGDDNPQTLAIAAEIQRLGLAVLAEARRILGSYESEVRVAENQLLALSAGMQTVAGESETANENLVNQRSLEQRAESLQDLYQNYLQRYEESVQQESLPLSAARVISNAELPEEPVFPNTKVILALSLVLGLGIGGLGGVAVEFLDRTVRTGREVTALGIDFLGHVPKASRRRVRRRASPAGEGTSLGAAMRRPARDELGRTLRRTRIALDLKTKEEAGLIGFCAFATGEGTTTVVEAFAEADHRRGRRVLLVDGNPDHSALSRKHAANAAVGLGDVLSGMADAASCICELPSGVFFLPNVTRTGHGSGLDIATAPEAGRVLNALRADFDLVLVDIPFLDSTAEMRTLSSRLDGFVLVAAWGRTDRTVMEGMLRDSPVLRGKLIGVVLNMTNLKRLRRYGE